MAVIELQPLCGSILEYYPTSSLPRNTQSAWYSDKKYPCQHIWFVCGVFFTALKIPEKLSFSHWELEMTDTSLLSIQFFWHLLSVFRQAAENFGSLLSLSDTSNSYVPKLPARLRPRLCSPPYPKVNCDCTSVFFSYWAGRLLPVLLSACRRQFGWQKLSG